jgi:hypothetical protein
VAVERLNLNVADGEAHQAGRDDAGRPGTPREKPREKEKGS